MKRIIRTSTTIWGASIAIAVLLFVSFFAIVNRPVDAQTGQGGRLVTIHDRGEEKVILTDATTVAEALTDAAISLDSHDAVEPAATQTLVASSYQINIYRARPVTVIDGMVRQKIVTPYQTAEQITKDAGITLYPEDTTMLSQSEDFVTNGAGLQLTIDRATVFQFTLYGTSTVARTQADTIGEMLKEKNISLGENDRASLPLTTPIAEGLAVQVWREGRQTITVEESVAFSTEQIKDADQAYGYKAIQTPGVDGKRNVTYEIEIRDGQEVGRTEIASITTAEPSSQVEIIGTKLPTPTNPSENQVLGRAMMLNAGYGDDQWSCLYNLWMRESGWRTTAGNTSSGAYGIPQSLPASKMAAFGADYLTNPQTQIAWGLNYIKGRYGTPCGAWADFQRKGWY